MTSRRFLVTGASRREGIAWAVVHLLVANGAQVVVQAWPAGDARELEPIVGAVIEADFAKPDAPAEVVVEAAERLGGLDGIVAAHAHSTS